MIIVYSLSIMSNQKQFAKNYAIIDSELMGFGNCFEFIHLE